MSYTVQIKRNQKPERRKADAEKLRKLGFPTYRHFPDGDKGAAAAQKYAAEIEQEFGVRMEIAQTYPVGFSVF